MPEKEWSFTRDPEVKKALRQWNDTRGEACCSEATKGFGGNVRAGAGPHTLCSLTFRPHTTPHIETDVGQKHSRQNPHKVSMTVGES